MLNPDATGKREKEVTALYIYIYISIVGTQIYTIYNEVYISHKRNTLAQTNAEV